MRKILVFSLLSDFFARSLGDSATSPIIIHDDFLYDSVSKERFTCRGVTVSPVSIEEPQTNMVDHFIDSREAEWKQIIKSLKDLNVNCIRIYQVCNVNDPEIIHPNKSINALPPPECGSHGRFMNALADEGIYAVVPVISGKPFDSNTLRAEIGAPQCYAGKRGKNLFRTAAARVSEFAQFDNTLAFNVGNELVLHGKEDAMPAQTGIFAYPCAKALARDLKKYMKNKKLRRVPTLYAMQDSPGGPASITPQVKYLACSHDKDTDDTVDILGFNTYSWCHRDDTYAKVYERYVNELPKGLNVPVVLTEYGCAGDKKNLGDSNMYASQYPWTENYRTWDQVPHIYNSSEMGARFSGAFAYELIMYAEMRKWQKQGERISESYGLIATKAAGNVDEGEPDFKKLPTFYELSKRYKEVEENVHYPKGEWTVPGPSLAMSCGEALNTTEMEDWLWNYFLVDRTTNEKSKWWSEEAARYLATGSMPPTQYKNHMITTVPVFFGLTVIFTIAFFVGRRYIQSISTKIEFMTYDKLVENGDEPIKKEDSDEDTTPTSYGSMGSISDINA